ncbi:MAG: helix-turn-helix transcriptional regulator [Rhizobiaceae bacterium]
MGIQRLITETGDELIVMSKRDYDALLARAGDEDAEDRMTLILAAEERAGEPLPEPVSQLLLNGDSLLRSLRTWRGVSQADLAKRAAINQGYLSEMENLAKTGSVEVLTKLADELDVPHGWLF